MTEWKRVEKFFLEAATAWAEERVEFTRFPGPLKITGWVWPPVEQVPRKDGLTCVSHSWDSKKEHKRYDETFILKGNRPIWLMRSEGYYPEEVIPFLLEALLENYRSEEFFAGRGVSRHQSDDFIYTNCPQSAEFTSFSTVERVWKVHSEEIYISLGYCKCQGGAL